MVHGIIDGKEPLMFPLATREGLHVTSWKLVKVQWTGKTKVPA